ncbi:MAG: CHASE2 domain-containing protein [Leptolyngbya sp. SIO1E4]|nr:CHASE2 domain-containing protein [Leptolyngbya sp. SIO1E4]
MSLERNNLAFRILPGFFVIFIVLFSRLLGLLEPLEFFYFDLMLKLRVSEHQDDRIFLIDIDGNDNLDIGKSPQIPSKELIDLVNQVQEHKPAIIGFNVLTDLISNSDESSEELNNLLASQKNIIVAEKFLPPFIYPLPEIESERVGFVDVLPDQDLHIRRSILGSEDFQDESGFKFSFSLLLAKLYLEEKGYILENGRSDKTAMRFGDIEIPRVYPNTGGYIRVDNGGIQTLVNYRSGESPFKKVTLGDFKNKKFEASDIENKIVIIGVTDPKRRISLNTPLGSGRDIDSRLMDGLDMQAHFTSQIISAVLDNRLLIKSWKGFYEYIFISAFGTIIVIWPLIKNSQPLKFLMVSILMILLFLAVSYIILLIYGFWLIIVPVITIITLNYPVYSLFFYQYKSLEDKARYELIQAQYELVQAQHELDQSLIRVEERRKVIERTFNIIHNGPLQKISIILNNIRNSQKGSFSVEKELEDLSQDVRKIGDCLKEEELTYDKSLYLKNGEKLDLNNELHELFHQVYSKTLERGFSAFKKINIKVRSFDEISSENIDFEQKRELCRYLEEAICNVGKHSFAATSLIVTGKYCQSCYTLTVQDNGNIRFPSSGQGEGTKHALKLAEKLNGKFNRQQVPGEGTCCSLKWQIQNKNLLKEIQTESN